ncbi:N-acetylglucosaminyl-phosphatidylinositol de-N-acetylase-like isoform X2 [Anneissia japonica]|nr:N-acetylglucosaminyl-phosphatidylinositol de-N-acetylase-like isoform X2 [Anneissia japonica]
MGEVRKKELINSCNILGLEKSAITIIEDNNLDDDPNIEWHTNLIKEYVKKQVHNYSIDKIVTFDAYGVSGHRNHASVFQAIRLLKNSDEISKDIEILVLESKSCLTKYLSIFSLPFVLLNHLVTNSQLYISSPFEVLRTQRAMLKHWSQLMWFRVLYICLSQYMIMNSVHVFEQ